MLPSAALEPGASPTLSLLASAFLVDAGTGTPRAAAAPAAAPGWWPAFRPGAPAAATAGAGGGLRSLILSGGSAWADETQVEREASRLLAVEAPGEQTFPGFQALIVPGAAERDMPRLPRMLSSSSTFIGPR